MNIRRAFMCKTLTTMKHLARKYAEKVITPLIAIVQSFFRARVVNLFSYNCDVNKLVEFSEINK